MGNVVGITPPAAGLFKTVGLASPLKFYSGQVPAGFASPADDYMEEHLDFNALIGVDRPQIYCARVAGNSMIGAGIFDGDLLVVEFGVTPRSGQIVVAIIEGTLTVKRLLRKDSVWLLVPENPDYPTITLRGEQEPVTWGVVRHNLRSFGV